ncbi:polysaccharide deacetylase family protein [Brevibacillus daliensis]|uniref:polysaccharide deacetylase family protein n=1 Tax=Brevibacillus daliensis TaxID=2892995 RepID=UPI001E3C05A5|nr:polysaccharide deacetylase family protein [Brevibacillus daliensis]
MQSWSLLNIYNKKKISGLFLSLVLLLLTLSPLSAVHAKDEGAKEISVLVVYSTDTGEITEEVRMLDLMLGHFTDRITFVSDESLSETDMQGATHLVYFGSFKKSLGTQARQLMSGFSGPFLTIGKNAKQLGERFSFLTVSEQVEVNMLSLADAPDRERLDQNYMIETVTLKQGETLVHAWKGEYSFPLFVKQGETAYFATNNLAEPFHRYFGEGLHSFFPNTHNAGHTAYIRLEDVHPFSDPALVKQAGDYLADKGIPFMIALIPVYTDPETRKMYHLKDKPEMVEVLQHLQKRGGSILLHGYTHQYRASETGEGFEFWDVDNNMPISGPPDVEVDVKERYHFVSKEDYDAYQQEQVAFEERYTKTRLEKGLQELEELGLYALGFEAPHYTISQLGYEVASRYFGYVAGQMQLGDRNWQIMSAAPYMSRPTFVHGMTVLPETAGFYDPASETPLDDFKSKVTDARLVRDGMIGMFYHPYLGTDHLQEMITYMETIPDLRWLDLQQLSEWNPDAHKQINSPSVTQQKEQPRSQEELARVLPDFAETEHVEKILWGIAALVSIMVVLFLLYTLRNRFQLRKQLFQERDLNG